MANICRTEIKIKANEAAIKDFALRYEACNDGSYPNEQDSPHIIDEFGAQAELLIDRIGSKWIKMYDSWPYWEEGMTEYDFALESASYYPSDMMNEIYRQLTAIDPNAEMEGRYWDEGFYPIGVFKYVDGKLVTFEEDVDVDEDEEYYWDDQIEPVFDKLNENFG